LEKLGMNKEFWEGKTVLITGHTGFKGSWLSLWLQKLNVNLIGISKSIPTNPSMYELSKVENGMKSIIGDIRDYDTILNTINENKPDIVIHMAAQSILRESYNNPIETYDTNIMGTVNILEAIRNCRKSCIVLIITSDKCYENILSNKNHKENDPMGGFDPYSSSKGCAELVTSCYRNSFFNPDKFDSHKISIASVRAGNVIGGGDWAKDRLIPDIIKGIINEKEIKIRNPDSIRPWQFVLDPLYGYITLIEKLEMNNKEFSEGWNFGPKDEDMKSVKWILSKLEKLWPNKIKLKFENENEPHEEKILKLNCEKAKNKLGWEQKLNLESSLEWTLDWYKAFVNKKDLRKISEEQIENYTRLI